jgi:hypothetical protein
VSCLEWQVNSLKAALEALGAKVEVKV